MEPSKSTSTNLYVKEEVEISGCPLTEDNDVSDKRTLYSNKNVHRPKVWAQTRQELCETLVYFRTYQSGVYHKDNAAYAYLIDAFGAKRDVCNGRVIISHGGGKSSKQNNGKYELFESQLTTDASVRSLLSNFINQQPLVVIVGNKCSITKFKVPARYCVLGMYLITHAWAEHEIQSDEDNDYDLTDEEVLIDELSSLSSETKKRKSGIKRFVRWKFRFEWMINQEFPPWWENPAEILMKNEPFSDNSYRITCRGTCHVCKICSIQIYETWICLNHLCKLFWKVWNSKKNSWEIAPQELAYKPEILNPGFVPKELLVKPLPFNIIPPPVWSNQDHGAYTLMHWRGYHCLRCGRVSCRVKWNCWECPNCHKIQPAPKVIMDKSMLVNPYRPIFTGPATDCEGSILEGSGIIQERTILSNGAVLMSYKFPENGYIFHYVSNEKCNKMPDLFLKEFQEIDSEDLKRHPVRSKVGSHLFARQFTLNVGAHYRFALDLDTLSWLDAPKVCNNTFIYIQDIVKHFVPVADYNFNQMLSAIYMEGQRMSWHDDGEKGVGPVIASLSLGSPAEMKIRRKPKKNEIKFVNKADNAPGLEAKDFPTTLEFNKKRKLMNDESSSNDGSKIVTEKTSTSKQIAGSTMDVQLPPFRNLLTLENDRFSSSVEEHMNWLSSFPIDISKICVKRRTSGPELVLNLHHGDLVIMEGKVLQENYDHMVIPKGFRIASTVRYIDVNNK